MSVQNRIRNSKSVIWPIFRSCTAHKPSSAYLTFSVSTFPWSYFAYISIAPPRFTKSDMEDEMTLKAGSSAVIEMPFTANPQPKVTWSYNGGKFTDARRIKEDIIHNMTSLSLAKVVRNDSGSYKVTLENDHGTCSFTIKIIVLGKWLAMHYLISLKNWVKIQI